MECELTDAEKIRALMDGELDVRARIFLELAELQTRVDSLTRQRDFLAEKLAGLHFFYDRPEDWVRMAETEVG